MSKVTIFFKDGGPIAVDLDDKPMRYDITDMKISFNTNGPFQIEQLTKEDKVFFALPKDEQIKLIERKHNK